MSLIRRIGGAWIPEKEGVFTTWHGAQKEGFIRKVMVAHDLSREKAEKEVYRMVTTNRSRESRNRFYRLIEEDFVVAGGSPELARREQRAIQKFVHRVKKEEQKKIIEEEERRPLTQPEYRDLRDMEKRVKDMDRENRKLHAEIDRLKREVKR